MTPNWLTVFLDLPEQTHEAGAEFWSAVTGRHRSPRRGPEGRFTTLAPPTGQDYLRSPGGRFVSCLVAGTGGERPTPRAWPHSRAGRCCGTRAR